MRIPHGFHSLQMPFGQGMFATSDTTGTFSWDYPAWFLSYIDGFQVWRSDNGAPFAQIATTTNLFYNDTGLTPNSTYFYTCRAYKNGLRSTFTTAGGFQTVYAETWAYLNFAGFSVGSTEGYVANQVIGYWVDNAVWDKIYSLNFVSPSGTEAQALVDAKRLTSYTNGSGAVFSDRFLFAGGGIDWIDTDFTWNGQISPSNFAVVARIGTEGKADYSLLGVDVPTAWLDLRSTSGGYVLARADTSPANVLASSTTVDLGNQRLITWGSIADLSAGAAFLEYPDTGYVPDELFPSAIVIFSSTFPMFIGTVNEAGSPASDGMQGYYTGLVVLGGVSADPILDSDLAIIRNGLDIYNQYYGRN